MMPLAGGAPGHPLSAAIAPAQCRWIPGAPVQLLRVRLCAGGAAAERLRAGAPHSHGALAGGRSAPPGVRRGRGASGHSASAQMDRHVVRRAHGDWGADARERALLDGSAPVAASISSASCAGTHSWLSSGSAASWTRCHGPSSWRVLPLVAARWYRRSRSSRMGVSSSPKRACNTTWTGSLI